MLHINDLTYRIGGRELFSEASAHVPKGHRVGLVGPNGAGKTTLFRLIAGDLAADGGSIRMAGRARLGQVAQEAPGGSASLIDTVLAVDEELAALEAEAETVTDPHRIGEVHTRLADIGAHTARARAAVILAGLGFNETEQQRPCEDFSGGWRMRVALAGTLFARPDLLLLDEPTNHLDLEASLWLEGYLASFPGTLLIISHDRDLLNRAVDHIIHLDGGKLTAYTGGYDRFVRTRAEAQANQAAQREKQLKERAHIQSFVDRFRAKATKARQAQSRIKMLARMEPIADAVNQRTTRFHFPSPGELAPPVMTMEGAAAGYDGKIILADLNLRLDQDDRIALLGANGNGKSTLVKLLGGRLKPMAGEVRLSRGLRIGYFAQHQAEELNMSETPYQMLSRLMEGERESKVRGQLGRFGFQAGRGETVIGSLSGGEKARLLFCLMSTQAPHLLLLDEPTNHLDVDAREALVLALNEFEGAVVLVSHDAHTIELVADRLWLVSDGGCAVYDGDMADYRKLLLSSGRARRASEKANARAIEVAAGDGDAGAGQKPDAPAPRPRGDRKAERRARAAARQGTTDLRRAVKTAEASMEKLAARVAALEAELANPSAYAGSTAEMLVITDKLAEAKRALQAEEARWLKAEEALNAATNGAAGAASGAAG